MWSLFGGLSHDMGIDLGTANTLVHVKGRGIVLREPSVVAIKSDTGDVLAVGDEAKQMIGRTPGNIVAIRPMKDGVIADFDVTQAMLKYFIRKAMNTKSFVRPRVVVGVPSGVTEVEKRAVIDAAQQAGAREAYLIEEPMAAAIGIGIDVEAPEGNMIVDIGGGTSEIAIISLNGVVYSNSVRIGGNRFDQAIIDYVRNTKRYEIGEATAEKVKVEIGSAYAEQEMHEEVVRGRSVVEGVPRSFTLNSNEILEALSDPIKGIVNAVRTALEKSPPELAADIYEHGMVLSGGGALLHNLDKLLREETGIPVLIADDPLTCVARGGGKALEMYDSQDSEIFD